MKSESHIHKGVFPGVVCNVSKAEDRAALLNAAITFGDGMIDVLGVLDMYNSLLRNLQFYVIHNCSIFGFSLMPPLAVYGVTKTALTGLMKALAQELGPDGIRVNALAPGVVRTKFSELLWKNENAKNLWTNQSMLQRIAEPEEMAGPAAFLCSSDASYVTGETLLASGGVSSRL
ncbi:short-chain dehydrogenase, putative [Perkinsus marinus ATCC 50983]|uniref:Short-chain dehydrogenase, putative n=1 Tax=Perkinsus marinus (strain ATCC 50983 / TXsc) TaxID=423536 RepID=C5L9E5_PERM5|nr:short-chain dehydrogenase, putative [Perkinsus marinus ATCC 50983]EER06626.1 short-chain dehydrogenase, putative [Perkinsus marinus ATCC 50983]|eukprot:XP_002774810.1 short-chain dehydrogenase, putative [Perkinsus marinus ATCC 50983]